MGVEKFRMKPLYDAVWPALEVDPALSRHLTTLFGASGYKKIGEGLLRNVFLIELVMLPEVNSTKFRVRWDQLLVGDPRACPFDECVEMVRALIVGLGSGWLDSHENVQGLNLMLSRGLIPYEMPIDYITCPSPGDAGTRLHRADNVEWVCDPLMLRTLKLREFLTDGRVSPDAAFFKKVLVDKIKVKTYLTDRALTGDFKTNREKRWETNPRSVQFATRRDAMGIEYELVTQMCRFAGFPGEARAVLQRQGILDDSLDVFRCPITLKPIDFDEFRNELSNPKHGRSAFQVGHLNPLKLGEPSDTACGHVAGNISWISEDGNRIQGSLSLVDVRALLKEIAKNYEETGELNTE